MKKLLKERFQELAGIKPLYEQLGPRMNNPRPTEPTHPTTRKAAAVLSHDDYKSVYFGDEQEFRDEGFEFVEGFPITPYTLVMWNDETLDVYGYDSEEGLIEEFGEMGFGMCDDRECGMVEIVEVINDSQPESDSGHGLALLAAGKVIAQGGD